MIPEDNPKTDSGVKLSTFESLPSCPYELLPQHFAAPDTTAHVCPSPADMAVTPDVKLVTDTGIFDEVVKPLPN
jgi:hypothetical protein